MTKYMAAGILIMYTAVVIGYFWYQLRQANKRLELFNKEEL